MLIAGLSPDASSVPDFEGFPLRRWFFALGTRCAALGRNGFGVVRGWITRVRWFIGTGVKELMPLVLKVSADPNVLTREEKVVSALAQGSCFALQVTVGAARPGPTVAAHLAGLVAIPLARYAVEIVRLIDVRGTVQWFFSFVFVG